MKNDKSKTKSESSAGSEFNIEVELQAGRRATFTYNDLELADGHYTQLQAQQVVGHLGIKSIQRSWRK